MKDIDLNSEKPSRKSKREQNKTKWFDYFCKLAKSKGGKVVSTKYEKMHGKMDFICEKGHEFTAKCHDIRQKGTWCSKCAGNKKLTTANLHNVAISNSGKLLSTDYIGLDVDHKWTCLKGHEFSHTPANVIYNGAWCPICRKEENKKEYRVKRLQESALIVSGHKGELISKKYVNSRTNLELMCKNNHQFNRTSEELKTGLWCPNCLT